MTCWENRLNTGGVPVGKARDSLTLLARPNEVIAEARSRVVELKQSLKFDPVGFTVVPPRRFEDLRVGDVFRAPSRTLTDAHAAAFQTVSADNHPIHYDVEYARRHGHVAPVVHGLQVFAFTAPGATLFPQYIGDVFVAFTSASCKFLKEVHAGDTLYPTLEVIALSPQGDIGRVTTRATVTTNEVNSFSRASISTR
jgi:acyl dehydratase